LSGARALGAASKRREGIGNEHCVRSTTYSTSTTKEERGVHITRASRGHTYNVSLYRYMHAFEVEGFRDGLRTLCTNNDVKRLHDKRRADAKHSLRGRTAVSSIVRFKVLVGRRLLVVAGGWVLSTRLITFIFTGEVLHVRF
jgi:hypothetical protein